MPQGERNLPVILLLDTSTSMTGEPIEAVRQGLELFAKEMKADEQTRQLVRLCVITFNTHAQVLTDGFVRFDDWQVPELQAGGTTQLDRALEQARLAITEHVRKPVKGGSKGDWKPFIYVFTDAQPTDDTWRQARDQLMDRSLGHVVPAAIVSAGCGPHVVNDTLKDISTGPAFRVEESEAAFVAFFQLISTAVRSSVRLQQNTQPNDPTAGLSVSRQIQRIP